METVVEVDSGICGFTCVITVKKGEKRSVTVSIGGSECKQIRRLGEILTALSLRDLFTPVTRHPVYMLAEKAGCHPSCPVPVAVIKAAEVAMGMALPKDVSIRIER